MLAVAGAAAVAAGQDLALVDQALDHHLAGHLDEGRQHLAGVGLGVDAGVEVAEYALLEIHAGSGSSGGVRWPRRR